MSFTESSTQIPRVLYAAAEFFQFKLSLFFHCALGSKAFTLILAVTPINSNGRLAHLLQHVIISHPIVLMLWVLGESQTFNLWFYCKAQSRQGVGRS